MVPGTLVNHSPVGEGIQHFLVDATLPQQVSVDPTHVLMLLRDLQRFERKRLHRLPDRADTHGIQHQHRFPVVHAVKSAGKVHRIAAHLLILVEPQVAPDGHLLPMIQPHLLRAGSFHFLAALPQKCRQIRQSGLFPLFFREGDVCSHITSCSCLSTSYQEYFLQVRDRDFVMKFFHV